jgi:hypothetical protein
MLPDNSSLRTIKAYNCSMIAVEGPNIIGKLNLSGVEIPFESQYSTKITLNPNAKNQPLMYGFLGNEITFLMLKMTYDETDPNCMVEEELYIEYYYKNQPSVILTTSKLLLLTGNSVKRIPQIFLNNPSELKVNIEILAANLPQSDLTEQDINSDAVTLLNLYNNSILSDRIYNCSVNDITTTGSTQLQIVDHDGNISLYLDYHEIDTIEIDAENLQLIIDTKSDTLIYLKFLSQFEMYQGHSRIEWVMEDNMERYLTTSYPTLDTTPPVITLNVGVDPITPNGNTYMFPVNRDVVTSGFTILPEDILYYFIDTIYDDRDGMISIADAQILIRENGQINTLTGITSNGVYNIVISVKDIANNTVMMNIFIVVDDTAPVINFYSGIGNTFTMIIPTDTLLPLSGVTRDDVVRKTVETVIDNIDGNIPKINIELYMLSGVTYVDFDPILLVGTYQIRYMVTDTSLNSVTYDKTMIVSTV